MLRALLITCVLFFAAPAAAQINDRDLRALITAMQTGDLALARQAAVTLDLRVAAGDMPGGRSAVDIHYLSATALSNLGDTAGALSYAQKAVARVAQDGIALELAGLEVRHHHARLLALEGRAWEASIAAGRLAEDLAASAMAEGGLARATLFVLGSAQATIEDFAGAEATWRRLIAIAENSQPVDTVHLRLGLDGFVQTLVASGRASEAVDASERVTALTLEMDGATSIEGLLARFQHALVLEFSGAPDLALYWILPLQEDAQRILPPGGELYSRIVQTRARLNETMGDLGIFRDRQRQAAEDTIASGAPAERLAALEELAELQSRDEKPDERIATLREIIAHVDAHPELPITRQAVAQATLSDIIAFRTPDNAEANALITTALAVLRDELGLDHPDTLQAEITAMRLRQQEARSAEDYREAGVPLRFSNGTAEEASYSARDLEILEAFIEVKARESFEAGFYTAINYISALTTVGRFSEALDALDVQDAAVARYTQTPTGAYLAVWMRYMLSYERGSIHLAAGQYANATEAFSAGKEDIVAVLQEARTVAGLGASRELHRFGIIYGQGYATAAWHMGQSAPRRAPAFAEAFEAVQLAGYGPAAASVSRASARKAAEDPELVSLIGELDALTNFQGSSPSPEIVALQAEIERRHPDYFKLQVPLPVPLSELVGPQPMLREDEALIVVLPMPRLGLGDHQLDGLVLAVTREGTAWAPLGLDQLDFVTAITRLHMSLDPGREIAGLRAPLAAVERQSAPREARFAFDAAGQVYDAIFGDPRVADLIEAKDHWTIVPFGSALPIPYAALVVDDLGGGGVRSAAEFRQARWLGQERALTIVPSVAALRDLRRDREQTVPLGQLAYVGFGDPAFAGEVDAPLATADGVMLRSGASRAAQLSALPRLPGTRREVSTLAALFGASGDTVALGGDATEARLRAMAEDGTLSEARILHFATHGLLSGAFSGLSEPALALTPNPASVGPENDGLLTASEAARLDLNAEWVILSACDTAGREGALGDGLGALAQGFFAAGAQSLLLSHWRVDDRAAEVLTTATVAGAEDGRTKAGALRDAMVQLASDTTRDGTGLPNSHPSIWAPFVLIGQGL